MKRARVKWVHIVTTTMVDPRETGLMPGQQRREIVVADMIDELGRRWRQYDDGDAELWGYAPNEDAG